MQTISYFTHAFPISIPLDLLDLTDSFSDKLAGNFYLTDLYAAEETELCDPTPILNLNRKEGKRPAVFLRFK